MIYLYWTYEELKRSCWLYWLVRNWDLYWTYEELKLHRHIGLHLLQNHLYWTYEELKLINILYFLLNVNLFILNLWGIETLVIQQVKEQGLKFILNLWGIETFPRVLIHSLNRPHLYWTYEELKLNITVHKYTSFFIHLYWTYEELKPLL